MASEESEIAIRGIDLLSFEATTADLMQLNLSSRESVVRGDICLASNETHSRSVRIIQITDENQKTCGYLHSFPETLCPPSMAKKYRELVALSLSNSDSRRHRPGARLNGLSHASDNYTHLFDHKTFRRKPWCLLNIMLVERKGSDAERVSIGKIHIDAWNKLKTQRKGIRLV
jgi:hypothetical protein